MNHTTKRLQTAETLMNADPRRALVQVNERFIADLQKINRRLLRADQRPTKRER